MFAGDHRPWWSYIQRQEKFFFANFLPTFEARAPVITAVLCRLVLIFLLLSCFRSAGDTTIFGLCQFHIVMLLWQALLPIEEPSYLT